MKLIIAIIRQEKLNAVQSALSKHDVCLMSVSDVIGYGREPVAKEFYRGATLQARPTRLRLEIAVNECVLEAAIDTIVRAASTGGTGQVGDGKIFVMELEQCVRIRNGERGPVATGTPLPEKALPEKSLPNRIAPAAAASSVCPIQPAVIFN